MKTIAQSPKACMARLVRAPAMDGRPPFFTPTLSAARKLRSRRSRVCCARGSTATVRLIARPDDCRRDDLAAAVRSEIQRKDGATNSGFQEADSQIRCERHVFDLASNTPAEDPHCEIRDRKLHGATNVASWPFYLRHWQGKEHVTLIARGRLRRGKVNLSSARCLCTAIGVTAVAGFADSSRLARGGVQTLKRRDINFISQFQIPPQADARTKPEATIHRRVIINSHISG